MAIIDGEKKLSSAATVGDIRSIVDIVGKLSLQEKEAIPTKVFDSALRSISRHAHFDRAESAYAMMMFMRAVGCYTSQAAVNDELQNMSQKSGSLPVPVGQPPF